MEKVVKAPKKPAVKNKNSEGLSVSMLPAINIPKLKEPTMFTIKVANSAFLEDLNIEPIL